MKKFVAAFIKFSAWAVPVAVLGVFAYMMINNTKPREVKDCVVTINVIAERKAANGRSVRITQKALDEALRQSAYIARQEAQQEYDKSFSTLLTILTIFGIAWPLVVAFIQYRLSKKELNKIKYATKKVKKIEQQTKEINSAVAISYEASAALFLRAYNSSNSQAAKASNVAGFIISFDNCMNYFVKGKDKAEIIGITRTCLKTLDSIDRQVINAAKAIVAKSATPDERFVSGKEIKEIFGAENIELYKKYRAFFIELFPWKFRGDGE